MANITKMKIAGTTYDIKDVLAERNQPSVPSSLTGVSCDSLLEPNVWFVSMSGGVTTFPDFPLRAAGWLRITRTNDNLVLQEAYPYNPSPKAFMMIRTKMLGTWSEWLKIPLNKSGWSVFEHDAAELGSFVSGTTQYGITFTNNNGKIHAQGTATQNVMFNLYVGETPFDWLPGTKLSAYNSSEKIALELFGHVNGSYTLMGTISKKHNNNFYPLTIPTNNDGFLFRLWCNKGDVVNEDLDIHIWSGTINDIGRKIYNGYGVFDEDSKTYASCDDVDQTGITFCSNSGGVHTSLLDFPLVGPGWLVTMGLVSGSGSRLRVQLAYPYQSSDGIKYRNSLIDGTWSSWIDIGKSITTTIVQEVSRDTYNNTYDISVSPIITTDTNGWLQSVDTDTQSETGKTDMTGAIMAMLNSNGYCHLGPGIFYVSGNINMPSGSLIEGCGKQTIIRLLQSVSSGYIIRMHTKSTLKNVCLSGGYSQISIDDGNIGGRKGINYIGNRDGQSTGVTPTTCTCCQIEGCWFENLDSGIYGYNTGGGVQEGIAVSNCYFSRCKVGINLDYYTEYSKFVNCITYECYYGCINNGGNNVFMNCTFHAVVGFVIDNSGNDKVNSAHGSVIGCTFNHIDTMHHSSDAGKGIAIKVLNTQNGFMFANCQMWYGKIHIENSSGIQIIGFEIGGGLTSAGYNVIETSGSSPVFIDNCIFQAMPNLSLSGPAKITNCWTYAGQAVTA